MIKVSLTYFVDFVLKSGTPKLTVVRNFKDSGEYDPSVDFYKKIREAIVAFHEKSGVVDDLDKILSGLTDEKKKTAYPALVSSYKKFIGKKKLRWFQPPSAAWTAGDLSVSVNPELGLEFDGTRIALKMYFKEEPLQKKRSEIIAHMMNLALSQKSSPGTKFGVLDIRRGKIIEPPVPINGHNALLAGEAASFATIYASL
jgi:hypothetical protein